MPSLSPDATTMLLAVVLLAAATAVAADPPDRAGAMPVDLTGVWNLDTNSSDDLAGELDVLVEQMTARQGAAQPSEGFGGEEAGVGVPGRRGSQGGAGGMGRPYGRGPARGQADPSPPSGPRELAQAMQQLLITVNGADIEIMDGTDWTRIWTPGGKPVQRDGPGGDVVEQAWWDETVLVLSTTGGPLAITRRLSLENDGRTLVADVAVRVTGTRDRIDARLVYTGY